MSDKYINKAQKYKLKYLKLKQEYFGEGGDDNSIFNKALELRSVQRPVQRPVQQKIPKPWPQEVHRALPGAPRRPLPDVPRGPLPGAPRRPLPGVPYGAQHGLPNGAQHGLPYGAQHGLPYGAQHGLPYGAQHGLPHGAQHGLPNGAQHGLPYGAQHGLPNGALPGVPNEAFPHGAFPGVPHGALPGVPHSVPQGLPHGALPGVPHSVPQGLPHGAFPGVPHGAQHGLPHGVPQGAFPGVPQAVSRVKAGVQMNMIPQYIAQPQVEAPIVSKHIQYRHQSRVNNINCEEEEAIAINKMINDVKTEEDIKDLEEKIIKFVKQYREKCAPQHILKPPEPPAQYQPLERPPQYQPPEPPAQYQRTELLPPSTEVMAKREQHSRCERSPPINLEGVYTSQLYPIGTVDLNKFYTTEYIGELYYDKMAKSILKQYKKIKKSDKDCKYTSEIVFAGEIKNQPNWLDWLFNVSNKQNENIKILSERLASCEVSGSYDNNVYIIRKNIGTSFDKLNKNDINNQNIKQILQSLKDSIDTFITDLYEKKYIIGDIKPENMTCDLTNNKVYYHTQNNEYYLYKHKDIRRELGNNPPVLDYLKNHNVKSITKKDLIEYLNNYYPSIQSYLNNLFSYLTDDNKEYDMNKIISRIAKNSDIYALTQIIKYIYWNFNIQRTTVIEKLINSLRISANENSINGPSELSKRLDEIINSL